MKTSVASRPRQRSVISVRRENAAISIGILVALIALTELATRLQWVSALILPPPSEVARVTIEGFINGIYWRHLGSTMFATFAGFAIAFAFSFVLAAIFVSYPRVEAVMYPFVVALQTLPKIALAPLLVIWLGFGLEAKLILVSIVALFPMLVNTLQGLRIRDRNLSELMLATGASKWQVFRYVRFPGSMPYVFAGINVAVIFALLGTIVAEFVGSADGLGVLMLQQRASFNVAGVFSVLLVLMVIGLTLFAATRFLESKLIFWAKEDTDVLTP